MNNNLINAKSSDFWNWFCGTSPPDNNAKDYNCPLPAPPTKAGGSKSGKRRKKPLSLYNNPYLSL